MAAVPKRRDELVDQRPSRVDSVTSGRWVKPEPRPAVPRSWHKTAKAVWRSFDMAGQVAFWQDTDWAIAFSICEDLSLFKWQEEAVAEAHRELRVWSQKAAGLSPDEREAAGFSRERPTVPRGASPQKMAEIYRVLGDLLVTESDRRRARIELDTGGSGGGEDYVEAVLKSYMDSLSGRG